MVLWRVGKEQVSPPTGLTTTASSLILVVIGDENMILEWESRPVGEPPSCPRDDHPMTRQQQMHTLAGGRFVVTYEVWVCSECDKVFLDRQQARRYGTIQMLDRLLKERNRQPQGQVLFDGEDIVPAQ